MSDVQANERATQAIDRATKVKALVDLIRSRFTPLEQAQLAGDFLAYGDAALAELRHLFAVEFNKYLAEKARVLALKVGQ